MKSSIVNLLKSTQSTVIALSVLATTATGYAETQVPNQYRAFDGVVRTRAEGITPSYEHVASEIALYRAMIECFKAGYFACGKMNADGTITPGKPSARLSSTESRQVVDGQAVAANAVMLPLALLTFGALNGTQDVLKTEEEKITQVTVIGGRPETEQGHSKYRIFEAEGIRPASTWNPEEQIAQALDQAMATCFRAGFFRCGSLNLDGSVNHGEPALQPIFAMYLKRKVDAQSLAKDVSMIPMEVITFGRLGGDWEVIKETFHYSAKVAVIGIK